MLARVNDRTDMPTKSKSRTASQRVGRPIVERRLPTHRPPTHPGEVLLEEFLKPLGITQSAFAVRLGVSFPRLNEVINRKRSVTSDTALRLAQVTGMSADFWLGLQRDWDLWHALRSEEAVEIAELKPLELVTFRKEVAEGIRRAAGSGSLRDIHEDEA